MAATEMPPVIIGGNGHSGTRVFAEIMQHSGVFCGMPFVTKRRASEDLRIIGLLNRWVHPYLYGRNLAPEMKRMKNAFSRRLRLYFPLRRRPWGFKNPRCMLILPVLHEIFPSMRFIHVIRDGRDMSLGNEFVARNRYVDAFLEPDERALADEQKMMLFWGRSNQRAFEYGRVNLGDAYRLIRWEDLCKEPARLSRELIDFAGGARKSAAGAARLVDTPSSMGRWATYPPEVRGPVVARGEPWLRLFGYL